jgi:imidazolonepropionase-like amidohydrolase
MRPELRIDAQRLWLGPGRAIDDGSVAIAAGHVIYAGPRDGAPESPARHEVAFLAPGVVDRHVHVGLAEPAAILAGGVTAVRDLAWPLERIRPLAERSLDPGFDGPRIEFCGPMLTAPGGYPTDRAWAPAGTGVEVRAPEEAAAIVARLLDAGAIAIKAALNANAGPTLPEPVLAAICDATHEAGREVVAHVEGEGQLEKAMLAGVDELAHTPWTGPIDDRLLPDLVRCCRVVSTLDMHLIAGDGTFFETALTNLRRFHAAGGRVLYGTDLGNGTVPPGIHASEIAHLLSAGLDLEQVLAAMTPGRLLAGMRADLTGLSAAPTATAVKAFSQVALVVRGGRVHDRAAGSR